MGHSFDPIMEKRRSPAASRDRTNRNENNGSSHHYPEARSTASRHRPQRRRAKNYRINRRHAFSMLPSLLPPLLLLVLLLRRSAIALPPDPSDSEGAAEGVSSRGARVSSLTPTKTTEAAAVAAPRLDDSARIFETSPQEVAASLGELRSSSTPLPLRRSLVEGHGRCCFSLECEGALEVREEKVCKAMTESDQDSEPEPGTSDVGLGKRQQDGREDGVFRVGMETSERTPRQLPREIRLEDGKPSAVLGPAYIVRWADYYPIQEHEQLLSRASGGWSCGASNDLFPGNPRRPAGMEPFDGDGDDTGRSLENGGDRIPEEGGVVLEGAAGWSESCRRCLQLVERRNAVTAAKFPSDFAVVRLIQQQQQEQWHPLSAANFNGTVGSSGKGSKALCTGEWYPDGSITVAGSERILEALRGSDLVTGIYEDMVLNRGTASTEYLHYPGGDQHQTTPGDVASVRYDHQTTTNAEDEESVGVPHAGEISQSESSGEHLIGGGAEKNEGNENGISKALKTEVQTKTRRLNREPEPEPEPEPGGLLRRLEGGASRGGLRGSSRDSVDASRQARPLHEQGFLGAGIRVAVFDTGLEAGGHDFSNVVERINWTDEDELSDVLGHGTHVAGVIGGRDPGCPGLAPDSTLHAFRLFSSEQVSYTSWFLDAFNYALFLEVDVINLSIGGPDFMDRPFVDKVRELSAHGVLIVSAVGNDGPAFGTQHNPADQADVIGVGALSASGNVASFQSRGMTTWELPDGYGRVKPDVLASGQHVLGPTADRASGKCGVLSGTSVASPVVAGAVALLASSVPEDKRRQLLNPASIKQVLVESARKVKKAGVFEQGAGALNVEGAFRLMESYTPRASLLPPSLDLTDPYMWPFSRQPLYYGAMPVMFNLTVLNGMGVTGRITSITWDEEVGLEDTSRDGRRGNVLNVRAEYPDVLWPWTGHLAISLSVSESGRRFTGLVIGRLQVTVVSEEGPLESAPRSTDILLPITASVVQAPPRHRRLLWDQYHSVPYPPTYSPRDYLGDDSDMLDRLGDHPHTNFRSLFDALLSAGYYLDILGSDWTHFDAENYGALLVVDPEAESSEHERAKLEHDVREKGLSLIVFADWYNPDVMAQVRFVDDNTRMPWRPVTGGSNVPAINDFLFPSFGMALGGTVLDGVFTLPGGQVHLASGNAIARVPPGGVVIFADSLRAAAVAGADGRPPDDVFRNVPVIGALDTNRLPAGKALINREGAGGRVFLFGDSSCTDDAALRHLAETKQTGRRADCLWLFKSAVRFACEVYEDSAVFRDAIEFKQALNADEELRFESDAGRQQRSGGFSDGMPLPKRSPESKLLEEYSRGHGASTHQGMRGSFGVRRWKDVPIAATSTQKL